MKKGILVVCLALSITLTASAFVHKAISATMKSQDIVYGEKTIKQQVMIHNNTTYVPLRDLSEIAGISVDYIDGVIYLGDHDTSLNNTGDSYGVDDSNNSSSSKPVTNNAGALYIGKNKAREIAIQHAGMQEGEYTITDLKLDRTNRTIVYEVEFFTNDKEYDYDIDAITGDIVSYDYDIEGFTHPSLEIRDSYIGETKAEDIALNHAQLTRNAVKYIKNELDEEHGRWKYEIQFKNANNQYEYEINAYTGEIIDYSIERD